jgi:hypothetical protein
MPESVSSGKLIPAEQVQRFKTTFEAKATKGEVKSCFYGINKIIKILGQDGCIGIRIYGAINDNGDKTFALVGVDEENKDLMIDELVAEYGILDQIA